VSQRRWYLKRKTFKRFKRIHTCILRLAVSGHEPPPPLPPLHHIHPRMNVVGDVHAGQEREAGGLREGAGGVKCARGKEGDTRRGSDCDDVGRLERSGVMGVVGDRGVWGGAEGTGVGSGDVGKLEAGEGGAQGVVGWGRSDGWWWWGGDVDRCVTGASRVATRRVERGGVATRRVERGGLATRRVERGGVGVADFGASGSRIPVPAWKADLNSQARKWKEGGLGDGDGQGIGETYIHSDRQTQTQTERHSDRGTGGHTDRHTYRYTDRHTCTSYSSGLGTARSHTRCVCKCVCVCVVCVLCVCVCVCVSA
jgi:hypothetical protein